MEKGGAAGMENGGAAGGGTGAPAGALNWLAEIIRVNSPGPESSAGAGAPAGAEGGCGASTEGVARGPSDSLWIRRVTLPDSSVEGAAGGAGENEGSGSTGCGLISSWRWPLAPKEAKRPVTLAAPAPRAAGLSTALKSGWRGHLISSAGIAGGGVGGVNACTRGVGAGAGAEGRDWKNCVKPPSADAESEAPEEKPFMRGEPGAAGGGSGIDLVNGAGGRSAGFASAGFTKIRVNSLGADASAGFGSMDGAGDWTAGACGGTARGA